MTCNVDKFHNNMQLLACIFGKWRTIGDSELNSSMYFVITSWYNIRPIRCIC